MLFAMILEGFIERYHPIQGWTDRTPIRWTVMKRISDSHAPQNPQSTMLGRCHGLRRQGRRNTTTANRGRALPTLRGSHDGEATTAPRTKRHLGWRFVNAQPIQQSRPDLVAVGRRTAHAAVG